MPPPSFLEQSFIMKGDTLNFISGVSKNGFPYGVRVMDFVLRKMLDNDKYSEVIGVSLGDRVDSNFAPYQHLFPSKFRLLSPTVAMTDNIGSSKATSKETDDVDMIRSLLGQSPSARVQGVLKQLQERLKKRIISSQQQEQQQATPNINETEGNNKIGVMIYSFSELVLHVGDQQALAWLRAFSQATSTSKISTCVLLHSSLHSPAFLAQIEVICDSVCHVHSTYGQFLTQHRDDSICCTTHTVRKAPSTGRVGEGTDLFTIQNRKATHPQNAKATIEFYELDAVVSVKNAEHDAASVIKKEEEEEEGVGSGTIDSRSSASTSSTLESLLENTNSPSGDGGNSNSNEKGKDVTANGVNSGTSNVRKEMLVVFDRSDPEFESDSDPDDDLDL